MFVSCVQYWEAGKGAAKCNVNIIVTFVLNSDTVKMCVSVCDDQY